MTVLTMGKRTWVFISDAVFVTFKPLSIWLTPTEILLKTQNATSVNFVYIVMDIERDH